MAREQTALSVNAWEGQYIDNLFQQWSADPNSVEPQWRQFFQGYSLGMQLAGAGPLLHSPNRTWRTPNRGAWIR